MCTLEVAIDGGRCFWMRSLFRLGHVVSYHFFIYLSRICFSGMNIVAWYHWARSGFVLFVVMLLFGRHFCGGVGGVFLVRLNFHMPTTPFGFPLRLFFLVWMTACPWL